MKIIHDCLPDFNERPQNKIDTLVFHCSAHSAKNMIDVLRQKKLSTHYIVDLNGDIYQTVEDGKRAWHAGVSSWRGVQNINHTSIGIEISSPSLGQDLYDDKQIKSLLELSLMLIDKYKILPTNIVAHSDIAPTRKPDPGIAFPWKMLAEHGVGIWYNLEDARKVNSDNVAELLLKIGYDITDLAAAQYAFCRHFLPAVVKKEADIEELEKHPYPEDFVLPSDFLPVLQACCYSFTAKS